MTTIYRFRAFYTKAGEGAVPSDVPTIRITDMLDNILVNAGVSTKFTNLPGWVLYNYSGADGLELGGVFHTTDTTLDEPYDLPSYPLVCQGAAADVLKLNGATPNNLTEAQVNAQADLALSDAGLTTTVTGRIDASISSRSILAAGAQMDLVPAPNATAVAAIQNGLSTLDLADLTTLQSEIETAIETLRIANAAAIVNSGVTGADIEIYNYSTVIATLEDLPDFSDYDKLWVTCKRNKADLDSQALFHIQLSKIPDAVNDGLQYLNKGTGIHSDGFITVISSTSLSWTIKAASMSQLPAVEDAYYGVKKLVGTDPVPVSEGGHCTILNITAKVIA